MSEKYELGDRVKDRISGLKGVITSISTFLFGCTRLGVQPEESKDGKPADAFYVDLPQAELIKKQVIVPPAAASMEITSPKRNHGPREDVKRQADVRR